jgi:hypothetical protein
VYYLKFREERERSRFLEEFGPFEEHWLSSPISFPELMKQPVATYGGTGARKHSPSKGGTKTRPGSPKRHKGTAPAAWVWCSSNLGNDIVKNSCLFGRPNGICPVGADAAVAKALVGAGSPTPTGFFISFCSEAAIHRVNSCSVKSRYFGKGVAVESCSPPSANTVITPCPQRSAIPSDLVLKLTSHRNIDPCFIHAAFLVHDDELLCTESVDELFSLSQLSIA